MILKSELTGRRLKRDLYLDRANQQWHNKNNSGGNFGFNLWNEPRGFGKNWELSGVYNIKGEVMSLGFGRMSQAGTEITGVKDMTYLDLITKIYDNMARIRTFESLRREVSQQ